MTPENFKHVFDLILRRFSLADDLYPIHPREERTPADAAAAIRQVHRFAEDHELHASEGRMNLAQAKRVCRLNHCPVLMLIPEGNAVRPMLIDYHGGRLHFHFQEKSISEKEAGQLFKTNNTSCPVFIFSRPADSGKQESSAATSTWPLMKKLGLLLRTHSGEIGHILVYAVIAGLISLSLPLGVQSIISYISSGQMVTSVVVLTVIILAGIVISGGMQYMQLYIAEHIQQKIFVSKTFYIASQIPHYRIESLHGQNPRELMNRFFDVMNIQKGTAVLLLEFSAAALQILFGLLLISVYHPVFIFPGLLLLLLVFLVLRISGPPGLQSSLKESKYKYKVARWLEEMAGTLRTFKLTDSNRFIRNKTEHYVTNYLAARKKHFRVLSVQYFAFVAFKTIITGGLLMVGCYLVINSEISLGQFVAAEIIIILIMGAVEKVIQKLDSVYDLLTAIGKVGQVTELPVDRNGKYPVNAENGFVLKMENISHTLPGSRKAALENISLTIQPGERICIAGPNGSGKTTLVRLLLGAMEAREGSCSINGIPYANIDKRSMVSAIGHITAMDDLFDGTLMENISLGRPGISLEDVMESIRIAGLDDYLAELPEGLDTQLIGSDQYTPASVARRILFARCIVARPKLIVLDNFLPGLGQKEKCRLLDHLFSITGEPSCGLVLVSNERKVMERADRVVVLEGGKMIAQGNFESIRQLPQVQELLLEQEL